MSARDTRRRQQRRAAADGRERARGDENWHWLEEGIDGQEALLVELDPYLVAADAQLCKLAVTTSYDWEHDGEPAALLFPPPDAIGWHVAHLAKLFDLYVVVDELDYIAEKAAERFGVELCTDGVPELLVGDTHLVLTTQVHWPEVERFRLAMLELEPFLGAGGTLLTVLPAERARAGEMSVRCGDDLLARADAEQLFAGTKLGIPQIEDLPVWSGPPPQEYLANFVKRHKRFFGRDATSACVSRMIEPDYGARVRTHDGAEPLAAVLRWQVTD